MTFYVKIDGETDTLHERADLDEYLHRLAVTLVDECEQEIMEGGHWSDSPSGEAKRQEEIDLLSGEISNAVERCLGSAHTGVNVAPWYAREQRASFWFTISEEDEHDC